MTTNEAPGDVAVWAVGGLADPAMNVTCQLVMQHFPGEKHGAAFLMKRFPSK